MLDGILGTGGNGLSPYMSIMASIVVDREARALVLGFCAPSSVEEEEAARSPEGLRTTFLFGWILTSRVEDEELSCGTGGRAYFDLGAMLAS